MCLTLSEVEIGQVPVNLFLICSGQNKWNKNTCLVACLFYQYFDFHQAWVASFERPKMSQQSLFPSQNVLSPYLRFGCLSARLFYWKLRELYRKVYALFIHSKHWEINSIILFFKKWDFLSFSFANLWPRGLWNFQQTVTLLGFYVISPDCQPFKLVKLNSFFYGF